MQQCGTLSIFAIQLDGTAMELFKIVWQGPIQFLQLICDYFYGGIAIFWMPF